MGQAVGMPAQFRAYSNCTKNPGSILARLVARGLRQNPSCGCQYDRSQASIFPKTCSIPNPNPNPSPSVDSASRPTAPEPRSYMLDENDPATAALMRAVVGQYRLEREV